MPTLAALVTVYHRIDPTELHQCLDSLARQTRRADEIVIVEDGPVGTALRKVIDEFVQLNPEARTVVLSRNQGAGPASQAGLNTIHTDFVARLDADDIADPTRFAKQLDFFANHPHLDVLGTALAEFAGSTDNIVGVRTLPEQHTQIAKYALINSPINNPSVMIRTAAIKEAGGYRAVHLMEDYDLYARLLACGKKFHNLPEPLTFFRISDAVFQRRTGKGMLEAERQIQRNLTSYGLISKKRAMANFLIRTAYRLLPSTALKAAYGTLFHRR
ncbi:glycosyltransferase [Corynebacterium epidermidicanis]|uniref:Glycosyl transferase family 2 n=1 Tax=Corynebacterium epidermidicanis TaxID=1050174 RepID=A0A0G3GSH5_9CORY|nr:glycosyltransferase [Corynebacterium epidermidicanis]AKK04084.1 Glycosyl transferase family 2 [Corynebacterium epidermidicanis]